jgi:hypothetical protein
MTSVGVFLWQFALAWLLVGLAIYLPGRLLLRLVRATVTPLEHLTVSLVGGAGLLVLVYWTLSLAQAQWFLWAYVLATAGAEGWYLSARFRRHPLLVKAEEEEAPAERLRVYWPLFALTALGVLAQTRYAFWTVWPGPQGMDLLAYQASDAPWHVFNIYHLARRYPPELAGFSGTLLTNYHMLSHLLWGALRNLVPWLDPWHLYLRVSTVFYSALLTLGAFITARAWSGKIKTAYLAAVLVLFTANFGYLLPLLLGFNKYFLWDAIFWVQSPMGTIFNPGVSSSYLFLFVGLWAFIRWQRERHWSFLVLVAICWGVLPGFKVYPGLLMIIALLMVALIRWFWQRDRAALWAWLAVLPVFLFVFLPPNLHAPSLIRFLPGFNLGTMLVAPDRMALMTSTQLKLLYAHARWLVAIIMVTLFAVFVVGNLGVRSLGLVPMARALRNFPEAEPGLLFMTLVTVGAFLAPVLMVQAGVQWNTIQFAYFGVVLAALPAAAQFWEWSEAWPRWKQYTVLGVLLAVGLPGSLQSLWVVNFNAHLGRPMLDALEWLKTSGTLQDVVLHPLPDQYRDEEGFRRLVHNQERGRMTSMQAWDKEAKAFAANTLTAAAVGGPAVLQAAGTTSSAVVVAGTTLTAALPAGGTWVPWNREDSFFVSGITFKNSYLESTVTGQILEKPVEQRALAVRYFYEKADAAEARQFLESAHITYVMLYPEMQFPFAPEGVPLKLEFENSAVKIYKFAPQKEWE